MNGRETSCRPFALLFNASRRFRELEIAGHDMEIAFHRAYDSELRDPFTLADPSTC